MRSKEELKKLFSRSDWNVDTIELADEVISRIAEEHLGLSTYPNQFEIITSEQMLDAYSLIGLPISYNHWKFGKDFVINQNQYKKGRMGLAYELVINSNQAVDAVFAWGGDLDWSHSSHPDTIAARIASGIFTNSANTGETIKIGTMSYKAPVLEKATLSLTSAIENNKVTLSANLTKADLAGLEVIMQYDSTKLTLTDVIFDAGSTITNFSTHNDGRLTFGSIDQLKTARIKVGTPYKLIFTPKVPLSNTAGLFYTVLADAVDATGKKIELIVE